MKKYCLKCGTKLSKKEYDHYFDGDSGKKVKLYIFYCPVGLSLIKKEVSEAEHSYQKIGLLGRLVGQRADLPNLGAVQHSVYYLSEMAKMNYCDFDSIAYAGIFGVPDIIRETLGVNDVSELIRHAHGIDYY